MTTEFFLPHRRTLATLSFAAVWLAAGLLWLAAESVEAQAWTGRGRLGGRVANDEGKPVVAAIVTLIHQREETGPEPIATDKKGRWSYAGLATGDWTVRIEHEEYRISEGTVKVIAGEVGKKPLSTTLNPLVSAEEKARRASVKALLEEGNQLLVAGEPAAARAKYEKALAQLEGEQQRPLLEAIARSYLEEGNTVEARSRLEALLGELEAAEHPRILQIIARSHYQDDDIDAAVETLQRALEIQPDDLESLRLIIDVLVATGREQEAEPYMARLPEGEKIDPNALLNVGISAYNSGDLDGALEKFDRVVGEYPDNSVAYFYRGLTYLGKDDSEAARADLEKMLELDPEHEKAAEARQFLDYLQSQ